MITSTYDADHLHRSFGIDLGDIDMGAVESFGVGANWGRVAPGRHSDPHQHDETETFVIVSGQADLIVDGQRTPVSAGMVLQFEPFETHYLDNTGHTDLLFATFYWRDAPRAARWAKVDRSETTLCRCRIASLINAISSRLGFSPLATRSESASQAL